MSNRRKVLADRALSRLLKEDWPRTLDELERLSKGQIHGVSDFVRSDDRVCDFCHQLERDKENLTSTSWSQECARSATGAISAY